jgi:hypothetical protein
MRLMIAALFALWSTQALGIECVQVTLKDVNGLPIATEKPLIGFVMPEGYPLIDFTLQPGTKVEAGVSVPCSPDVLVAVNKIFNDSCTTETQRATTARANNIDADLVNKRCKDIYTGLNKK